MSLEYEIFDKYIKEYYKKGIDFVSGAKLYGFTIDTENLEEVIAALYFYIENEKYMVKTDVQIHQG